MIGLYKKKLSLLLDNELELSELKELTDVLRNDSALDAQLDRYALIRAALSDDVSSVKGSLLQRVQAGIGLSLVAPLSSSAGNDGVDVPRPRAP